MLPESKGNYQARPMKWKVGNSGTGSVEFAVEFNLFNFWDGAAWQPVDYDITGFFYLVTKEGKLNDTAIKQVKEVFGWNPTTGVNWLATAGEFPDCQVSVDFEVYNGKSRAKVKWLNPLNQEPNGGIGASDPQEVSNIDAKYGHLFRASGGAPAPKAAAKPPAANQTSPAKRAAWEKFNKTYPQLVGDAKGAEWKSAIKDYRPGKLVELWTDDDWTSFAADDFVRKAVESPLEESAFQESEIPF